MIRPPGNLEYALKILQVTASGGATVLLSTFTSCYLAVIIEKSAHKIQYHFFPHWYRDVEFALGLDLEKNRGTRSAGSNSRGINHYDSRLLLTQKITELIEDNNNCDHHHHDEFREKVFDEGVVKGIDSTLFSTSITGISSGNTVQQERTTHFNTIPLGNDQFYYSSRYETNSREIPTPVTSNQTTTNDKKTTTTASSSSRVASFFNLFSNDGSESMSSVLQNCAMTA